MREEGEKRERGRRGEGKQGSVCVISLTESLYARLNGLLVCIYTYLIHGLPRLDLKQTLQTRTIIMLDTLILYFILHTIHTYCELRADTL